MVWLVTVDGVLGQCALAPCVGTTYAMYVCVNVQIDKVATLDIVGMAYTDKVFLTIVPGTDT